MSDETPEEKLARFKTTTTAPRWLQHGAAVWAMHSGFWVPSIAVEVNGYTAYVDTRADHAKRFPREGLLMDLDDLRVLKTSPFAG